MSRYDHRFSTLTLDGRNINDFADATDSIQFNYPDELGALNRGTNRAVWVASGKGGVQLVVTFLQNSPDTAYLDGRRKSQNNLKTHQPIQCYYKDIVNGDEIRATNGWIRTRPNYVRGNGHNNVQWTIEFENEDSNLTEGKN